MAAETKRPRLGALHSVEAGLHMHQRAQAKRAAVAGERDPDAPRSYLCGPAYVPRPNHRAAPPRWSNLLGRVADRVFGVMQRRWVRRVGLGIAGTLTVCLLIAATLWWRLSSGPISLDMITPWLTAAIAENLGSQFRIEVGGTVLERDEHGRAAMRIRDIKVRDRDGTVIASAPKAEVGLSSASLFSGNPRAERLNLVGAVLAVRVESDGRVSISTGSEQRPMTTTLAVGGDAPARGAAPGPGARRRQAQHAGELRRLPRLARQSGCARPRWRRTHRNRAQERQPGRRRPAQRPPVEVREHPFEPHPPACRRTRFQARLRGGVASVAGPGRGEAGGRRRARRDTRRARHLAARSLAGAAGRRREDGSRRIDFGDPAGRVCRRRNPVDRRRAGADDEGRDHRSRQPGVADSDRSGGDDARLEQRPACAGDTVPDRFRRHALYPHCPCRSPARSGWKLGARPHRRLGRALSGHPRRGAGAVQPHHRARPPRSGGAAAQHRAGRGVGQGHRASDVGQSRLFLVGPAARGRPGDAQHFGRRVQAAMAALRQSAGAPMGDGAGLRRLRRAGRDRDQCADLDAAQWRPAGAR